VGAGAQLTAGGDEFAREPIDEVGVGPRAGQARTEVDHPLEVGPDPPRRRKGSRGTLGHRASGLERAVAQREDGGGSRRSPHEVSPGQAGLDAHAPPWRILADRPARRHTTGS
jgi:hypothetical protein